MQQGTRILVLIALIAVSLIMTQCAEASEKLKLSLNFVPWSMHHGKTSATNERHRGVGLSIKLTNGVTYGAMHYKNSYGDNGWLVSVSTEFKPYGSFYPGLGLGYAPAYSKSDNSVVIGWLSLRYKWFTLLTAPTEVTTIMLSVPFR